MSFTGRLRRIGTALKEFDAEVSELTERKRLLESPWEEEFLHWSFEGGAWRLHGRMAPPADGRRHSVTRAGWCPGAARRAA